MSTTFAPIPLHHAVTIRLTKNNFLIWRAQLLPYLRSTKLMGYLDGSIPAPTEYVASTTGADAEQLPMGTLMAAVIVVGHLGALPVRYVAEATILL
jgi:hypothetical protein